MLNKKITPRYILIIFATVLFTWVTHEFAHWLGYRALGYEAQMSLNQVRLIAGKFNAPRHSIITAAMGPLITIMQAVVVYLWFQARGWNKYLYPLLFIAFYMRSLAGFMNLLNLNDEGKVSQFLGLGTFTIPVIVAGFLFWLLYRTSKRYELGWKFQLGTTLAVMVATSVLILGDMWWGVRLL